MTDKDHKYLGVLDFATKLRQGASNNVGASMKQCEEMALDRG